MGTEPVESPDWGFELEGGEWLFCPQGGSVRGMVAKVGVNTGDGPWRAWTRTVGWDVAPMVFTTKQDAVTWVESQVARLLALEVETTLLRDQA